MWKLPKSMIYSEISVRKIALRNLRLFEFIFHLKYIRHLLFCLRARSFDFLFVASCFSSSFIIRNTNTRVNQINFNILLPIETRTVPVGNHFYTNCQSSSRYILTFFRFSFSLFFRIKFDCNTEGIRLNKYSRSVRY